MWKEWLSCSDPVLGICHCSIAIQDSLDNSDPGSIWTVVALQLNEHLPVEGVLFNFVSRLIALFNMLEFPQLFCWMQFAHCFSVRVETRWWYQSLKVKVLHMKDVHFWSVNTSLWASKEENSHVQSVVWYKLKRLMKSTFTQVDLLYHPLLRYIVFLF